MQLPKVRSTSIRDYCNHDRKRLGNLAPVQSSVKRLYFQCSLYNDSSSFEYCQMFVIVRTQVKVILRSNNILNYETQPHYLESRMQCINFQYYSFYINMQHTMLSSMLAVLLTAVYMLLGVPVNKNWNIELLNLQLYLSIKESARYS